MNSFSILILAIPVTIVLSFKTSPSFYSSFSFTSSQRSRLITPRNEKSSLKPITSSAFPLCTVQFSKQSDQDYTHIVNGINCVEMKIALNSSIISSVTVLEATASSQEDLVNLALNFDETEDEELLESQPLNSNNLALDLNSGDPYGAVLWPASSAVAEHLLSFSSSLEGLTILELGAGTGLVSIVAAMAGANDVISTDYELIPLKLLEYAAENLNKNGAKPLSSVIQTDYFDMCDKSTPLPPADIIVAADIMYEPHTGKAMAYRTLEALKRKSRVIIGDSPGRPGRPAFLKELDTLGVKGPQVKFEQKMGRTCSGERHDLICGNGSTSVSETPQDLEVAIMDLSPNCILIE